MKIMKIHKKIKDHLDKIRKSSEEKQVEVIKKEKKEKEMVYWINIKAITVVKIIIVSLIILYLSRLIGELSNIVFMLLISSIIAAAISPIVNWLEKYKVPRSLSITLIYTVVLGLIFVLLVTLIPVTIKQLTLLTNYLIGLVTDIQDQGLKAIPYIDYITKYINEEVLLNTIESTLDTLVENIGNISADLLGSLTSILTNVVSWGAISLTIFVMTFLIVIDEKGFEKFILSLIPKPYESYVAVQGRAICNKLGAWLRGQLVLNVIIATIAYIFLTIVGSEYAFTIALITGITEFVPIIGPLIAAVPAVLLSLTQSVTLGIVVLIGYILLNTTESNIITPLIMKKSVGLNPLAVILAMAIGVTLIGPIGIILSIPVASAFMVIINDYTSRKK